MPRPSPFPAAAAIVAIALAAAAPSRRPAQPPRRIVSLNLCADELLIALADRSQVAGLTEWATDPVLSYDAGRAKAYPFTHRSAEEVLALRPDLVLGAPASVRAALTRLRTGGVVTTSLNPAEDYDGIVANIRAVARAVGHPERGETLVARMDAALARIPKDAGRGRVAAYYQRDGYLTGTGTLIDDLMRRVGLVNLATRLDKPALARVSLEEMALARPDYLIVETASARQADRGAQMLRHPLLARIPRLTIPQSWTVCGGPGYVRAAEALAAQLRHAAIPASQRGTM